MICLCAIWRGYETCLAVEVMECPSLSGRGWSRDVRGWLVYLDGEFSALRHLFCFLPVRYSRFIRLHTFVHILSLHRLSIVRGQDERTVFDTSILESTVCCRLKQRPTSKSIASTPFVIQKSISTKPCTSQHPQPSSPSSSAPSPSKSSPPPSRPSQTSNAAGQQENQT